MDKGDSQVMFAFGLFFLVGAVETLVVFFGSEFFPVDTDLKMGMLITFLCCLPPAVSMVYGAAAMRSNVRN